MSSISRFGLTLAGLCLITPITFAEQATANPGTPMTPAAAPQVSAGPGSGAPGAASGPEDEANHSPFGDAEVPPYGPVVGAYGPMFPGMMMGRPWGPCRGTRGGARASGQGCGMRHGAGCSGHKHGHGGMDHAHEAFRAKYRKLMARLDILEARMNAIQTMLERLMER
jgi:hypothetical protein